MIKSVGYCEKPKKFSRQIYICSCECPIIESTLNKVNILDKIMIKYEIKPNEITLQQKLSKHLTHSGYFKQIIELPKIFEKLNENDYNIYVGHFTRDNRQMPCIRSIELMNVEKYKIIKNQENRKNKLNKIING